MLALLLKKHLRLLLATACAATVLAATIGTFAIVMALIVNIAGHAEICQRRTEKGNTYLMYLTPEYIVRDTKDRGSLYYADLTALVEQVPQLNAVALWDSRLISGVKLGSKSWPPPGATFAKQLTLGRVTPTLKDVIGLSLTQGRFIEEADLQHNLPVCVIGARLHRMLGGGQVIGQRLSIDMIVSDGTRPVRVTETFSIVGVLQAQLPLLAALPLDDKTFWHILPRLIDIPRLGQQHGVSGIRAFHAFQREQLAFGRLAINDAVFIPWKGDDRNLSIASDTLVYLSVSTPADPGSRRQVLDQETMSTVQGKVYADPCEKCLDALCVLGQIPYYMPQGLMDVANELRTVLMARLGDDKLFQFLHLEALGDTIRFDLHWLNNLLGAIILTCFVLGLISIVAVVAFSKITSSCRETAEVNGMHCKRIRPSNLSRYARICSLSVALAVIVSAAFSYWLVLMVILW